MISPLSLSAKVFSLNLLYYKAVDDKELPATLNPFFRLYLVCPLYLSALLSSLRLISLINDAEWKAVQQL